MLATWGFLRKNAKLSKEKEDWNVQVTFFLGHTKIDDTHVLTLSYRQQKFMFTVTILTSVKETNC